MGELVTLFPKIWNKSLNIVTYLTRKALVLQCKIVYFIIFKEDVCHHNKSNMFFSS